MRMYNLYKTVQGFPTCANAKNPKFRWQAEDPKMGVDFKVWDQDKYQVGSESECTSMSGVYKENLNQNGGKCYTYKIVKRICLMVAFKQHPETASYAWEYRGGCYQDGKIAVYELATPGQEYNFNQIPIEVREDESLYGQFDAISYSASTTAAVVAEETESGASTLFYFLSSLSMLLALVSGILFAVFFFRAWKGVQAGDRMKH